MIDKKDEGRDDNSEKVESSSPNILKLRTDFIRWVAAASLVKADQKLIELVDVGGSYTTH